MPDNRPYIPERIVVHLGTPQSNARNVTVTFPDYIKNVASSEIFPTWPEASLRANIYVQVTFALNRVYTEWYRSRGYDFDITNSTQYDQAFVYGRDIFENISDLVDEQFNNYIVRRGSVEPLFAAFCDGVQVTCQGLSQWGTVTLANR
ncbi:MAG: spore cortex-lytic protein, partial [Oscillospiraceae bacterium]